MGIRAARTPHLSSRAAGLTAVLGLAGALTACSPTPDPAAAADALAEALATGDLASAPLDEGTREQAAADVEEALGAVADLPHAVDAEVGEVDDGGERPTATVALEWSWDLDGADADAAGAEADGAAEGELAYRTEGQLVHDGERWTVTWARELIHPDLGEDGVLDVTRTPAERGEILGAGGGPIVTVRPVLRIGIDRANLAEADVAAAAAGLAAALGFEDPQAFADRAAAAGPRAFVEAIVVRQYDTAGVDVPAVRGLPGVLVVEDELPLAPTSGFARPILGTVGAATAEIVEESDGAVRAGEEVGLSGLQRQYDEALRGTPGTSFVVRRADGTTTELYTSEPVAGQDVTVTLDPRLQMVAESVLEPVAPAGAIVALRPSTGEVLAAASGPGSRGFSTATLGAYAPGSTFKVATALALLRSGLTPQSPVECTPTITVDGREFSNYPDFPAGDVGPTTLQGAVASSCNTVFIAARDRAGAQDLADAAASLGLGVPAQLGVPAVDGEVPADASGTEHAASMIGQGRIQASPLAMATVAASVARGERVTPVLVTDVGGEPPAPAESEGSGTEGAEGAGGDAADGADDAADDAAGGAVAEPAPLTEAEAQALREMMRAVVVDGTSTFLADVPGDPVSAKSGTAEYGTDDPPRAHAWMIAFRGDLAVAVFVEDGIAGAQTAGPLLEDFLRRAA
ncbi:penicillin-binding transpeptidase domain-containing protein [Georgenia sp. AZ-5]|uniref:penicillin-binding transpeptidase domain-containing protein n=1 Tax=Georgenia sp. AZ-5 TaxID=3367526 RepID=UPI00375486DA